MRKAEYRNTGHMLWITTISDIIEFHEIAMQNLWPKYILDPIMTTSEIRPE